MFGISTQGLMLLCVFGYGTFIGYCLGRARGYRKGADMVKDIYNLK